jgi:mono/diheme cytochrome c family protein
LSFWPTALGVLLLGASPGVDPGVDPEGGRALARLECARCHEIPGAGPVDDRRHCVRCHRQIRDGTFEAAPAHLKRWQGELRHLLEVPSLDGLSSRVRRGWLEAFLLSPEDLRPALEESMPRLPISADDAAALARALVPREPDERPLSFPATATIERGRLLFGARGCAGCHRFAGEGTADVPQAPDLRHARARMPARALDAWLRDPAAMKPGTPMPKIALADEERLALVRFLLEAPLPPAALRPVPTRLPLLARRVVWEEVNARVFQRSCWHCHSDAHLAGGDGGPGNTGGFGYAGRGLSLASWSEALAGSLDDAGEPRSIFTPLAAGPLAGVPRLTAHLLARQAEEAGAPIDGLVGMPLGLPALTPEELQLIESWIAQGRPR